MCGIAGILDWDGAPADSLDPMLKTMVHRGPDDEGRFVGGPIAMGMRRLSIIDLNSGHQPIFNEDDSVVVVFNGEIYNYVELRADLEKHGHRFQTQTDTEVLVHLYEEEGVGFLNRLNGMFGFSIWDKVNQRLFIARDRLGVKPMYFAETPRGLLYATELKSILAAGLVAKELDADALCEYLVHFYIPGERSAFRRIKKLLPGHYIVADAKGIAVRRWWDLTEYTSTCELKRGEATERLRDLFLDSVRLRMRSDVPVGSYLSGGLDSSLVTAAAARQTDIKFATFSVGFTQSEFDELPYARAVADFIKTEHHEIRVSHADALDRIPSLVWHMDEPNGDSAILPTYLVSRLAVSQVKVALSGIGADELFGGYHRYHARLGKLERLAFLPRVLLRLLRPLLAAAKSEWGYRMNRMIEAPPPWIQFLENTHRFNPEVLPRLLNRGGQEIGAYTRRIFKQYPGNDFVNQRMYVDAHSYLPDQILALTDRMSMAVSLEARTPFLDYRLVQLATSLPGPWKVEGKEWKIILKEALGDLVPAKILRRPKWGFAAPVRSWMNAKHLDALVHLLSHSTLADSGYMDGKVLKGYVDSPETIRHQGEWLWALAILELWFRIFCIGGGLARPEANLIEFAHSAQ